MLLAPTNSSISFSSIALLLQANVILRQSFAELADLKSLEDICSEGRDLYIAIARRSEIVRGKSAYPDPERTSSLGMGISIRFVNVFSCFNSILIKVYQKCFSGVLRVTKQGA